jgi:hypothetical protein
MELVDFIPSLESNTQSSPRRKELHDQERHENKIGNLLFFWNNYNLLLYK